jgi:hypothetical protein
MVAAAVVLVACAEAAPGAGGSGVRGRVVLAPTCPVETVTSPCPPEPVQATVRVESNGETVETVETEADGTFVVDLEPGDYVLIAEPAGTGARAGRPTAVTVEPGVYVQVDVVLDTGIRTPETG